MSSGGQTIIETSKKNCLADTFLLNSFQGAFRRLLFRDKHAQNANGTYQRPKLSIRQEPSTAHRRLADSKVERRVLVNM